MSSAYFDAFRESIIAAHAEGGTLRLRGAQISPTELRTLADWLNEAADQAIASRPKDPQQVENEREAAEALDAFDRACILWVELTDTDTETTPERLQAIAEELRLDYDELLAFEYEADPYDAMDKVIAPLSIETETEGDTWCEHCESDRCERIDYSDQLVYRVILCTGGPHHELRWKAGEADSATFLSLPWFGRVEQSATSAMATFAQWVEDEGIA